MTIQRPSPWLCRAPLIAAAAIICLLNGFNLFRLTTATAPRNPWETTEIVEAWRSLAGLPVYELSQNGHATHMYGALVPWLQGEIFRWTGPNNISGRALSLGSALLTVTLLTLCMKNSRSLWYLVVTWAAILGVNHRSGHYFAENRPDMLALLFATLAVILFGSGQHKRRHVYSVLGTVCLVTGFFIKQTVAIFAIVPLLVLVLVLGRRRPARSEVLFALLPLAAMTATIVALKILNPAVYHYMVVVPRGYSINWPQFIKFFWEVMLDSPLFVFLVGEWIVFDHEPLHADPRTPWLIAVLAVTIPFSSLAHAKAGGWPNSMLPALLAMTAFCALRLPRLLARLENLESPLRSRLVYATFLSVLLLMTTFPHITVANGPVVAKSPWDRDYNKVVAIAAALPGKVICPEDPSIPLHARRYAGRNIFSEKDARPFHGTWPKATPATVLDELRSADFVVDVANHYWDDNFDPALLEEAGFAPDRECALDTKYYTIWRRTRLDRGGSGDQTALLGHGN
jgi:hypothetical protein